MQVMGSGNFAFCTPLLVVFVLQFSCGWSLYASSHMGNGVNPRNSTTVGRHGTKQTKTNETKEKADAHKLSVGARNDERTDEYSVKRIPFMNSEALSLNEKLSLSRASAFHDIHSMEQSKRNFAHARVESDLTLRRTKREPNYNTSLRDPSQTETHPEPQPKLDVAIQEWSWAWYLHIYLFAVLYWLVAMVSLVFTVVNTRLSAGARKSNAALKLSLHLSLLLFSVSRALSLSIDPYGSRGIMGSMVAYILWSAGFPIIVTSFGLLLLVLFDTTKLSLAPPRFQNFSLAIGIMAINFVVVMVTDVTVLLSAGSRPMMIICHVYLMVAGLTYAAGFMWVGHKISTRVVILATDKKN